VLKVTAVVCLAGLYIELMRCLWQHTHEPNVHQLIVKVDGWKQVRPVSVDKVGVYFRHAATDIDNTSKMVCMLSMLISLYTSQATYGFKCACSIDITWHYVH